MGSRLGLISLLVSSGLPPLSMSGVLLSMSFAGEAGGEIKLTGGTFRVSASASLPSVCHGGVDTGGGDAERALDGFNSGDWESNVGPSVKPEEFGEV